MTPSITIAACAASCGSAPRGSIASPTSVASSTSRLVIVASTVIVSTSTVRVSIASSPSGRARCALTPTLAPDPRPNPDSIPNPDSSPNPASDPNPNQEGALCYRSGEAGALEGPAYEQLVEKRIPLSSVLNVRVSSEH